MLVLVGFAIVIVVGLNLAMVFGDMFKLGGGLQMISGFAVAECQNTVGGVACSNGVMYEVKPQSQGCSDNQVPVCTNACELERANVGDDRICPSYCTEFCLPADIAGNVMNSKVFY